MSNLYRSAVGLRLADLVHFAIAGGEPPDLDYEPFHSLLPETDTSGISARHFEAAIGWLKESKHRPRTGEPVRAFQFVIGRTIQEVRSNRGIAGRVWARLREVPENDRKLNVHIGFSLLDEEPEDLTHFTVLGGVFQGKRSALVFCDVIPSGIRRLPISEMFNTIEKGIPPGARRRFRNLKRRAYREGLSDELRTSLFLAHKKLRGELGDSRGAMYRGLSTQAMEDLDRSLHAGLPSRRSEKTLELVDPMAALEAADSEFEPESESVDEIVGGLDARSREVLHLMYVEGLTQAEIAERFRITQARVSQIAKASRQSLLRALRRDDA